MKNKRKKIALLAAFAALLATAVFSACGGGTDPKESAFSASDSTGDISSVSTPSDSVGTPGASDSDVASESESETEHEHTYGEWTVTKEATCTEAGSKQRVCGICGKPETEAIPAGHTYEDGICTVCGEKEPSKGLEYTLNSDDDDYSVTGIGSCTDTDIVIPSVYEGMPVTSIGDSAFFRRDGLTSIVIPDSVKNIGSQSFSNCLALTSITIGNNVASIGYGAFSGCNSLTSIIIPDGVTTIEDYAFYGCSGLTSIEIPDGVTTIEDYAFYGCSGLTSVTIGNGMTHIGDYAFYYCYKLVEVYNLSALNITKGSSNYGGIGGYAKDIYTSSAEPSKLSTDENGYIIYTDGENKILMGYTGTKTDLTLPEGITEIYQYAFENCGSLTNIVIPDSVTSIGNSAFYNCSSLTSVTIGNGVTTIGEGAFQYCSLTSIIIPDSVTGIGNSAFRGCNGLTSVTIGNGVTEIGRYAFSVCSSLTSVTIGSGVKSIGYWVFGWCGKLTSIEFKGTIAEWNAISKDSPWDSGTGNYTITCTDGKLDKSGNKIE